MNREVGTVQKIQVKFFIENGPVRKPIEPCTSSHMTKLNSPPISEFHIEFFGACNNLLQLRYATDVAATVAVSVWSTV